MGTRIIQISQIGMGRATVSGRGAGDSNSGREMREICRVAGEDGEGRSCGVHFASPTPIVVQLLRSAGKGSSGGRYSHVRGDILVPKIISSLFRFFYTFGVIKLERTYATAVFKY